MTTGSSGGGGRVSVLWRFNSKGHLHQDAVEKSLGVGSLRSYPGPGKSRDLEDCKGTLL